MTRLPETADPDAGGLVGGDGELVGGDGELVGGDGELVGRDGALVEIDGDAGEGARDGVGKTGADGVDAGCPARDCAAGAGFLV